MTNAGHSTEPRSRMSRASLTAQLGLKAVALRSEFLPRSLFLGRRTISSLRWWLSRFVPFVVHGLTFSAMYAESIGVPWLSCVASFPSACARPRSCSKVRCWLLRMDCLRFDWSFKSRRARDTCEMISPSSRVTVISSSSKSNSNSRRFSCAHRKAPDASAAGTFASALASNSIESAN